ncbi:MAG: hypothetical protein PHQ18_05595 [Patescibacteria group bacterium]|nr:hypothetical protein [Patescibacteria group bacterium]
MSEFDKPYVPNLSEGDVDTISSETKRENAKLKIFVEDLLRQKGLKSTNVIFERIMEYTRVNNIELSKEQWKQIQDHINKFISVPVKNPK